MNVLLFGSTGMVGQGVLRECLLDPDVEKVVSVGRSATGQTHPKLREIVHADLFDLSSIEADLTGLNACFFSLGVSSVGMKEEDYRRITYDLTLAVARTLLRFNPAMTFIYVSGAGTGGRSMWAQVKGKAENDLLAMPFKGAYMFRPGLIVPLYGVRSKTAFVQAIYSALAPVMPWLFKRFPKYVTTTEQIGKAMLKLAKRGAGRAVLESSDINSV